MGAIGRALRWLFVDPVREAIFFVTVALIVAYAAAVRFFDLADDQAAKKKKERKCET